MSAHELVEKMEEAGHAGGHGGHGKQIGITMAILGVMLAFCAAMVGSARTELIKATIDKSNLWSLYQTESTKYRVMQADVEMLHALTPSAKELARFEERLKAVKRVGGNADNEDTAELKEAIHVATVELADVLTPDKEDEERLSALASKYKHDMAQAKEDAEAYEDKIEAHHEEAEWYERAQVCAEVGIVIASIALLLSSRIAWVIAVVIGLSSGGIIGYAVSHTRAALHAADAKIEAAKKRTLEVEKDDDDPAKAPEPAAAVPESKPADTTEPKKSVPETKEAPAKPKGHAGYPE